MGGAGGSGSQPRAPGSAAGGGGRQASWCQERCPSACPPAPLGHDHQQHGGHHETPQLRDVTGPALCWTEAAGRVAAGTQGQAGQGKVPRHLAAISVAAAGLTEPAGHLTTANPAVPQGRPAGPGTLTPLLGHACVTGEAAHGRGLTGHSGAAGVRPGPLAPGPPSTVYRAVRGGGGDRRLRGTKPHAARLGGSQGPDSSSPGKQRSGQGAGTGGHQARRTGRGTRKCHVLFFLVSKPVADRSSACRGHGVASGLQTQAS